MADYPLPALPPQFDPSKPFTQVPEATATPAAAPAAPPAFNPGEPFEVIPDAPPAPAGPAFDPNAKFTKVFSLADIGSKSEQELADDTDFNPTQFFNENPGVANSPAELRKLLEAYRVRRERGITGAVVGKALKSAPTIGAKFAKGVYRLGSNIFQLTGLQALANQGLASLTGETQDVKAELLKESGRQAAESGAEILAASETAATGLADLGRTGARKVFGKSVKDLSEQELLQDLATDAAFQKQLGEVGAGKGEVLRAGGLDAESLAKSGIILEPDAIENLSLVDPLTLVATGGVGKGAFTLLGAGGKLLATVPTVQAGIQLAEKLGTAVKPFIPSPAAVIGKPVEVAGKGVSALSKVAPAVGAAAGLAKGGPFGLVGGILAGERAAPILARVGESTQKAGQAITQSKALEALSPLVTRPLAGAALGVAAAAPIAALAEGDEQAGAILGGGLALGTAAGTGKGIGRVTGELSAKTFFDPHAVKFDPVDSPAYGRDAVLDTSHQQNLAKRSVNEQGAVTTLREIFRPLGAEIYSVDGPTYAAQLQQFLGRPPTAGELATQGYFDFVRPSGEKVVLLNGDNVNALNHETGHVITALLAPETRNTLVAELQRGMPPEQFARQKAAYEARLGNKVTDLQFLDEALAENFSAILNNVPANQLTAPQGFLRALGSTAAQIAEAVGVDTARGRTTPDLNLPVSQRLRAQFDAAARELLKAEQPAQPAAPAAPAEPVKTAPAAPAPVTAPAAPATPAPTATQPPATPPARNIRVTKAQQDALSQRAAETGITQARELAAKDADPNVAERVNSIADSMEAGNPVLEIEHLGIVSEGTPEAPAGRTQRRAGEQAPGYAALRALQVENRANAPESIVNLHQKTFVPVRFTDQGGTPTLIAMSSDKVIANIHRIVKSAADKGAEALIPYENAQGRLTEAGWQQAISDVQKYTENQANGFRGDGQRLTRPSEGELSIPAENREYSPQPLSPEAANFANLIQGLATPETAREIRGKIPGNIKGQILAEANKRPLSDPSVIRPKNVGKQEFKSFPGRRLQEVNPLRNELAARGVDVRQLIEVTERIRAKDIASVKPRADLNFKAPVTDIIRGGFLPKEGETVQNFADRVNNSSPEEFTALIKASPTGALTPDAWQLGLNLKNVADLQVLLDAGQRAVEASRTLGKAGDFDGAFAEAGKSQYFREAYEAATDTGSAAIPTGWRRRFPEGRPPFPGGKEPAAQFLPRRRDTSQEELPEYLKSAEQGYVPAMQADQVKQNGTTPQFWLNAETGKVVLAPEGHVEAARSLGEIPSGAAGAEVYDLMESAGWLRGVNEPGAPRIFLNGSAELSAAAQETLRDVASVSDKAASYQGRELVKSSAEQRAAERFIIPKRERAGYRESDDYFKAREEQVASEVGEAAFLPGETKPTPSPEIQKVAEDYAKSAGIPYSPSRGYSEVRPALAKQLADFYESAKHSPEDPAVAESYKALADETEAQYRALTEAGYTIEPFSGKGEPYKNSAEAIQDIRENKHLFFLKTEGAFSGAGDNPMLAPSGVEGLLVNDVFRGVHDFFGHGKEGYSFGPRGEFNAWRAHSEMYSPAAQGALAAETLAQNSWVNFGKHLRDESGNIAKKGEPGYVELTKRPFAEQKSVIVPDELIAEARGASEPQFLPRKARRDEQDRPLTREGLVDYNALALEQKAQREAAKGETDYTKYEVPAEPEPRNEKPVNTGKLAEPLTVFHYSKEDGITVTEPSRMKQSVHNFWGEIPKTFFFVEGSKPGKQFEGRTSYTATIDKSKLYDASAPGDPLNFFRPNRSEADAAIREAGYQGVLVPIKGGKKVVVMYDPVAVEPSKKGAFLPPETVPTDEQVTEALSTDKKQFVGAHRELKPGTPVGLRIDIPAFVRNGTYVVTVHEKASGGSVGKRIGYDSVATVDNPTFFSNERGAEKIRAGSAKFPIATVEGEFNPAREIPTGDEWTEVGFNPRRHSYFYEKGTDTPVTGGSQAVSAGNTVYVKDAVFGDKKDFRFLAAKDMTPKEQQAVIKRIQDDAEINFPEAKIPQFVYNDDGSPKIVYGDTLGRQVDTYKFQQTVRAAEAAKGKEGKAATEAAAVALGDLLADYYNRIKERPDITAGSTWYSLARKNLVNLFGDDAKFFAELLGSTSPQTDVKQNFKYALDAYNQFKAGKFDVILKKYREGKQKWATGDIADYVAETGKTTTGPKAKQATRGHFLNWWIEKNELVPYRSEVNKEGKPLRYGMHSKPLLRVLDGTWLEEVVGPKTPNFMGNLTGDTFAATIDIWAARALHRLGSEVPGERWRILPESETGVTDSDFAFGQRAFQHAADKIGIQPDALQAIMWFAEKDHWEKQGWTGAAGKEKSDFNTFFAKTKKIGPGKFELSEEPKISKKKVAIATPTGEIKAVKTEPSYLPEREIRARVRVERPSRIGPTTKGYWATVLENGTRPAIFPSRAEADAFIKREGYEDARIVPADSLPRQPIKFDQETSYVPEKSDR